MSFAAELGIKPWELGLLTTDQVRQAVAEFERQQAEYERTRG